MSDINPFFLDKEFQEVEEARRGSRGAKSSRKHAAERRQTVFRPDGSAAGKVEPGETAPHGLHFLRAAHQDTSDIVGTASEKTPPTPSATRVADMGGRGGSILPPNNPQNPMASKPERERILTGILAAKQKAERKVGKVTVGVEKGQPRFIASPTAISTLTQGIADVRADRERRERLHNISVDALNKKKNEEIEEDVFDTIDEANPPSKKVADVVRGVVNKHVTFTAPEIKDNPALPSLKDVTAAGFVPQDNPTHSMTPHSRRLTSLGHAGRTAQLGVGAPPASSSAHFPSSPDNQTRPDVPELTAGHEPSKTKYGSRKPRSADDVGHIGTPSGRSLSTVTGIDSFGRLQTRKPHRSHPHRQDQSTVASTPIGKAQGKTPLVNPSETRKSVVKAALRDFRKSKKAGTADIRATVGRMFGMEPETPTEAPKTGPKKVDAATLEKLRQQHGYEPKRGKKGIPSLKTIFQAKQKR